MLTLMLYTQPVITQTSVPCYFIHTASSGNVYAITQSLPAGTEVAAGTVVTVQFGDNSVLD